MYYGKGPTLVGRVDSYSLTCIVLDNPPHELALE